MKHHQKGDIPDEVEVHNMNKIGYWAAQEQYSLSQLLEFVVEAEKGGFISTMTSDHFHPWRHDNAFGNFTWIWISAAAERTKKMHFTTGVTAPVYRYHPAIIAQAFASLDTLYPGRIGLGLGTSEAMNETPLGFKWPSAKVRLVRTREAIEIIKSLWKEGGGEGGENDNNNNNGFVTYNGAHYHIHKAKLYTPPASHHIPIYLAATGSQSTKVAAQYTDGLITYLKPDKAKEILSQFDKAARASGRNPQSLEKIAEYKVSYSEDYDRAFESTNFWRATLIENIFSSKIADPRKLEAKAKQEVPDEKLKESVQVTTSIEECIGSIEEYLNAGFTKVYVHSTSPEEIKFIQTFCKKVLPYFSNRERRGNSNNVKKQTTLEYNRGSASSA
ncbi:MAG TPA: TIGR03557 family F420-dependent LLM class oxidoreductase [Nitrososphaera sp.]|nr:TIGR03557 family F420-dependent LLM class oxidoreductase [Nitrososphaera sp.]